MLEDQVIKIFFKVEYENKQTRSFSKGKNINKNILFKKVLLDNIKYYIEINSTHYEDLQVKNIYFSYLVSNLPLAHESHSDVNNILSNNLLKSEIVLAHNNLIQDYSFLPLNMDISSWNSGINFTNGHRQASFIYKEKVFYFQLYSDHYICTINSPTDNSILFKFKDTYERGNLSLDNFTRIIYKEKKGS